MRTKEEKQEWKAKMANLAARIKAMSEVQRQEFAANSPVHTCEGHALSPWNQCALILQAQLSNITVTQVAGFRQWKKANRQVSKGEHSCGCILVPIGKGKPKEGDKTDPEKMSMRFKWVPMFDVTQTQTTE